MWKNKAFLLLALALLLAARPALAYGSLQFFKDGTRYRVEGNSDVFKYDAETGTLKLGTCDVTWFFAEHLIWGPPQAYYNQATWNTLFREILDAEPWQFTVPEPAVDPNWQHFVSPAFDAIEPEQLPSLSSQVPGMLWFSFMEPGNENRWGHCSLSAYDDDVYPELRDAVGISMLVVNNGKDSNYHFMRKSAPLHALVRAMTWTPFAPHDLASATKLSYYQCAPDEYLDTGERPKGAIVITDPDALARIAGVLMAAMPETEVEREYYSDKGAAALRFETADGRPMCATIAHAYDGWDEDETGPRYLVIAEEIWQDEEYPRYDVKKGYRFDERTFDEAIAALG